MGQANLRFGVGTHSPEQSPVPGRYHAFKTRVMQTYCTLSNANSNVRSTANLALNDCHCMLCMVCGKERVKDTNRVLLVLKVGVEAERGKSGAPLHRKL